MISSPDDFLGWPQDQKLDRYRRVILWHDYIGDLHGKGKVSHVWGSHQLLSRASFVNTLGLLIAVYQVLSWQEFDELLLDDPLRDVSRYVTTPLTRLLDDRQGDVDRYERHRQHLVSAEPIRNFIQSAYRSLFSQQPAYVGQTLSYNQPLNPPTKMDTKKTAGDPLELLVMGVNPEGAITHWDDTRQLFHYEKVIWWHDYMSMLVGNGKVTHVWGAHTFFDITRLSGLTKGAGVAIYRTDSFDEFDELLQLDPIRESTVFWTVLLQPIADQRRLDEARLQRLTRAGNP